MKRRIIKQASQAYTLTLPVNWIRKHSLKEGSEVEVTENQKSLLISTSSEIENKKISLEIKSWEGRVIRNHILSLYASGFDEIKIKADKDITKEITIALSNLIGFALISQEKNEYQIKDLNSGKYQHIEEILKRVFQMILLFYDSAIKDIFGKEEENLESLKLRDTEVNKFCLYLQRAINKSSHPDIVEGRVLFTYSFALEKIGDEIERLWRTNIKYKPKKAKELRGLLELSKEGLEKSFDLIYQFSPKIMSEIYELRENVRDKSLKLKITEPSASRLLRHAIKIIEDAADLHPLAIMLKIKKEN